MSYHIKMRERKYSYDFSSEKNNQLIKERGISFEEIIVTLEKGKILDILEHPNSEKYPHQKIYIVQINNYIYSVPFVRKSEQEIFLKTAFPNRKLTKKYLGDQVRIYEE